ncbi:MAG: HEAT repeat domain-containing protein [Saprospiraceae bacterium]|nr:HEAT repeat domain-containing protein [Saprospiraceae bacterium]
MNIKALLNDKNLKAKPKVEALSNWFLSNADKVDDIIAFAKNTKDPIKATCIEGMEFASKIKPEISSVAWLNFVTESLSEKAARIRWESAKVIGNIAHLYPDNLDNTIVQLLINAEHPGTVVRWSTAFALGKIIQIKTNNDLIAAIESICANEEKNSIKTIYQEALQKIKHS